MEFETGDDPASDDPYLSTDESRTLQPFSKAELNDLVRDLYLLKQANYFLSTKSNAKILLDEDARLTSYPFHEVF